MHRHQHHHPKTDTILDVYRKDNPHWQDEVLRALYKKVLDFKRSSNQGVYSSALGVLAYIKAFKKICLNGPYGCNSLMAQREDDNLADSIKVRQDELRYNLEQDQRITNVITNTAISIIGALLTLSSLASIVEPPIKIASETYFLSFVADRVINHPSATFLFLLIGIIGISLATNWDCTLRNQLWFKDIARMIQSIRNQTLSAVLMLCIAILLGVIAYFVYSL